MNLGRTRNPPPYSVRTLATCERTFHQPARDSVRFESTEPDASACRLISVVFRKCAALTMRVFSLVALSFAVVNSEASRGCADEDDEEAVIAPAARQFVLTEQQFDQMVFGSQLAAQRVQVVQQANGGQVMQVVQGNVAQSLVDFRKRMEALAATEIDVVDRRVSLTDVQKRKLKLAARGDIEQYISRVNELRPKLTAKPLDQLQYVELMRELQPLRMVQQSGIVGDTSLFRKTLRHCLTDEQCVRWQSLERERRRTAVESALLTWQRMPNGFMLTDESRRQFVEVIVEHGDLPETRNSYIHYVVLVEAGKLEDRLKPLVSEEVWDKLQKQITQARQIEASLRKSGQWPARAKDDDVADSKIDGVKE